MSKLIAESLDDYLKEKEELNEGIFSGPKGLLKSYINKKQKDEYLTAAFAQQISKVPKVKDTLLGLSDEDKMRVAKEGYELLSNNPKITYPKLVKSADGTVKVGGVKAAKGKNPGAGQ